MSALYQRLSRLRRLGLLLSCFLLLPLHSLGEELPALQRLRFPETRYTAFQGQTVSPVPEVYPEVEPVLTWSSDNPFVAQPLEEGGIACQEVGNALLRCTSQDASHRSASLRLIVEPALPIAMQTCTWQRGRLVLTVKNRMWETQIQRVTLEVTCLDAQGEELTLRTVELSGFHLFAAKVTSLSFPPEAFPEGTVSLRLRITENANWQLTYALPPLSPEEDPRAPVMDCEVPE